MKVYDYLFVTHLPAFYKINLYNEIAKHCSVFVIFVGKTSTIRTPDFTPENFTFDHGFLNEAAFETRSIVASLLQLKKMLSKIRYRKIVVGGWDLWEFWALVFCHVKAMNALALESSIVESKTQGIRGWVKKRFLSRISTVFMSGEPHAALLKALQFTGKTQKTLGVGIFNYGLTPKRSKPFSGKFLYVGRLAPEKNLVRLLEVFKQLPQYALSVVGQGPLLEQLQAMKPHNVHLQGHVPNDQLSSWYQQHDVFILPSLYEPWGLVVEEALYHGLPVIASSHVGCALDLVQNNDVGVLCDPQASHTLLEAIHTVVQRFEVLCHNALKLDFKARDDLQVRQYLEALS